MTKVIDLRPKRQLKNAKFEKYQFSSDTYTKKFEKELKTEVLRLEPSTCQDSFLEARLFAFHNHLFKNPYDSSCWFIDKSGGVWKYDTDGSLDLVFNSKGLNESEKIYNPSIEFAANNIIVVSDGSGTLEILVHESCLVKNYYTDKIEPAVVVDARYSQESSNIIISLYRIDESLKDGKSKKISRLIFLHYNFKNNNIENKSSVLELIQKQTLQVRGVIENVFIEEKGKYCYIIGQDQVEFDYDSINPIGNKSEQEKSSEIKIPKYCWSQDEDSITIYVKIPEKGSHVKPIIETLPNSLSVTFNNDILLNGKTSKRLESDLTTWKCKDDTLEIELSKSESGLMWDELISGDTGGEYLPNQALAAEIHERLSHLCSSEQSNNQGQPAIGFNSEQLEECDLSGDENILQRVNLNDHNITHMVMLGSSNRVLFSEKEHSGEIVCLRHDHDGCIWKMKETVNNDWEFEHLHTFPGIGYVEASKTNKKFCLASPDGSFITIVEHARHAFLYEKPQLDAKVSKQRILDFGDEVSAILGAVTTNKYLIILTKNKLYQLEVYS